MSDRAARIDSFLQKEEASGFAGVVLIARAGDPILARGYGLANRSDGTPMGTGTVLSLGSVTKQFTAAAILTLETRGLVSTGDRLSEFFPVPEDKQDITLFHLLTHTSGLESDFAGDFDPTATREWYLERAFGSELRTRPGSRYHYSNAGFSVLAAVIEGVTGVSYETHIHETLLEPAGMSETGYLIPVWDEGVVAHGYVGDRDWGTILEHPMADDGPYWNLRGNGGIHTTVLDMLRWDRALRSDSVLPAASIRRLLAPYVPEDGPESVSYYGFGWVISRLRQAGRVASHDGQDEMFHAHLRRYLDEDLVLVSMSNVAEHSCIDLTPAIESILLG